MRLHKPISFVRGTELWEFLPYTITIGIFSIHTYTYVNIIISNFTEKSEKQLCITKSFSSFSHMLRARMSFSSLYQGIILLQLHKFTLQQY